MIMGYEFDYWESMRQRSPFGPIQTGVVTINASSQTRDKFQYDEYAKLVRALARMTEITEALDDAIQGGREAIVFEGSVIQFAVRFDGVGGNNKTYTYAAIYVEKIDRWFTTGATCPAKGWPSLDHLLYHYHVVAGTILEISIPGDHQIVYEN
jgi:hypothetical protein